MTTKFIYKYYDVKTHVHKGTFPYVYWDSDPIPLYGCPGITSFLRFYPTGNEGGNGYASVFFYFNSTSPKTTTLQIKSLIFQITPNGGYGTSNQMGPYTVGVGGISEFGAGRGWYQIVGIESIFKEPKHTLQYTVTVDKVIDKQDNSEIVIQPAGQQEVTHTSKDVKQ